MCGIINWSLWELVGTLCIIAGLARLIWPKWVKKWKLSLAQRLVAYLKKCKTSTIRILGLILIIIGAALIYYL